MRIFVCGATGLIGRHTIPHFLANRHTVSGLSRSDENAKKLKELGVTPVPGSIDTLDVLTAEASKSDVVLYAAFDHSTTDFAAEARREGPAVEAVVKGLAASNSKHKLLFFCSGVAFFPPDKVMDEHQPTPAHFRQSANDASEAAAKQGIRVVSVRLAMLVHTPSTPHMFLGALYGLGNKEGAVPYMSDGSNRWPAAAATDVGELISLVTEQQDKLQTGVVNNIHALTEWVTTKELAETIAEKTGQKSASYSAEQVQQLGPFYSMIFSANPNTPNEWTKKTFGWNPTGKTLWEDAKEGKYFGKEW